VDKTISLPDLKTNLESIMADISSQRTTYIIAENDQPNAVIIDYAEYLRLKSPKVAEAPAVYSTDKPKEQTNSEPTPPLPWTKADEQWLQEHIDEIAEKYSNKWINVREQKLLAWYSSVEKKWVVLEPDVPNPEKGLHEFVGWKHGV